MTRLRQLLGEFRATMRFIFGHPANRGHRVRALGRFFAWQLWKRATGRPLIVSFWRGLRLRAYPDSKSAGLALYTRLPEYDDMLFVLRYLRPNDVFVDVGANIGLYSLLAGSMVGRGQVLAFEPYPLAAKRLRSNARLNGLDNVQVRTAAVGAHAGSARLTTRLDTVNHIVEEPDGQACIDVPLTTLDAETGRRRVAVVKIDTEGFETEVLKGAETLLRQADAPVWIVEVNGLGKRYGRGDDTIREIFSKHEYRSYRYDADRNVLEPSEEVGASERDWNLIFVRRLDPVLERLASASAAVAGDLDVGRRRPSGDAPGIAGGLNRLIRDALSYNTYLVVSALTIGFLLVLLASTLVFGPYALLVGLIVLVTVVAVDSTVQLRLLRRSQKQVYRQIESLFSVFATLKITRPLPPMRGWAISPDFGNVLISLIQEHRPKRILEAGSGVSTLVAAYSLQQLGRGSVVSLDQDPTFAAITRENVRKHGLQDIARVLYAPLKTVNLAGEAWLWYDTDPIEGLDRIDMIIIDGPSGDVQKLARYPALPLLHDRLSDDAVIVLDDCARPDEREIVDRWLEDYDGFVCQDVETEKGTIVLRRIPRAESVAQAAAANDGLALRRRA